MQKFSKYEKTTKTYQLGSNGPPSVSKGLYKHFLDSRLWLEESYELGSVRSYVILSFPPGSFYRDWLISFF